MPHRSRSRSPLDFAFVVNRPSNGARTLSYQLRARNPGVISRVVRTGRLPIVRDRCRYIVNWGCTNIGEFDAHFNPPDAVARAVNKVKFFEHLGHRHPTVPHTTFRRTAEAWLDEPGAKVVCRTKITGHSGNGIVIARSVADLVDAPLYTLYVKKRAEFRAHLLGDSVLCLQQKRRSTRRPVVNSLVRSFDNGWVYCSRDVDRGLLPDDWHTIISKVVNALSLDFAAVDFIIDHDGNLHVLEANTSPGIESSAVLNAYHDYFLTHIR